MQLGARWRAGDPPHRGVPPLLHPAIAEQERQHPAAGSWTLTWLEGRPRCRLDDAVLVALDAAGAVIVRDLAAAPGAAASSGSAGAASDSVEGDGDRLAAADADPDEDDDWLS